MGINWTDDIIARLTEHYKDGLTISASAARLTAEFGIEFSRSAVVGKRHRWGLTCGVDQIRRQSRQSALKRHADARKRTGASEPARVRKPNSFTVTSPKTGLFVPGKELPREPLPKLEMPEDFPDRVTLKALTKTSCRWPIGDPQHEDFGFCGKDKVTGLPYCEGHARRAYRQPEPRQRPPQPARVLTMADFEKV